MTKEQKLAYQYEWRRNNPEKRRATTRRCYLKNRESFLERARKSQLKCKYGLTVEEYERRVKKVGGLCEICGQKPSAKVLHVDHNHDTGSVRGLLCSKCNLSLGGFGDDVELLRKAVAYLERYETT